MGGPALGALNGTTGKGSGKNSGVTILYRTELARIAWRAIALACAASGRTTGCGVDVSENSCPKISTDKSKRVPRPTPTTIMH